MKKLEIASYVAVLCSCALLAYVLLTQYVFNPGAVANAPQARQPTLGRTIALANVNWAGSDRSIVLAISSHCGYCMRSTSFYHRLSEERNSRHAKTRLVAVMAEGQSSASSFLDQNHVSVDQVATAPLSAVGVDATPTLLLVDGHGKVLREWVGLLDASGEKQVISQLD